MIHKRKELCGNVEWYINFKFFGRVTTTFLTMKSGCFLFATIFVNPGVARKTLYNATILDKLNLPLRLYKDNKLEILNLGYFLPLQKLRPQLLQGRKSQQLIDPKMIRL
eukprot:NODE_64_length_26047_cov_1.706837.p18 type:complete len:109 gc:universal NODE_64_length_26047_cov_1.706837:10367-10693(+)